MALFNTEYSPRRRLSLFDLEEEEFSLLTLIWQRGKIGSYLQHTFVISELLKTCCIISTTNCDEFSVKVNVFASLQEAHSNTLNI